eukprot:CAMPEP_0184392424 /NCGR_PEP_ID=MMETSP0007-20130409/26908_1 /TAXON_ID=97485 /ORGANISM="Prymnesium parvum, Strain Texoma1" /LENGTH=121 /DNA_ID=CAMNT_0026742987 /DNA_START=18 /DNA_END=379 /DNA_ORIENTATION=+
MTQPPSIPLSMTHSPPQLESPQSTDSENTATKQSAIAIEMLRLGAGTPAKRPSISCGLQRVPTVFSISNRSKRRCPGTRGQRCSRVARKMPTYMTSWVYLLHVVQDAASAINMGARLTVLR